MNRHDRRKALVTGSALPAVMEAPGYTGPTPTLRVLRIDGAARSITQVVMRMHPDDFRKILGKSGVSWAKLGEIDERIHIMLAGDPTPQEGVDPTHRWYEREFVVADDQGRWGPVLRGRAAVFGFAPALKKACSTPVNPIWLQERVRWLSPTEAIQLREEQRGESAQIKAQPRLEDQSGEKAEAQEP